MPHEGHFLGSPADWLRYAYSDLELARVSRPPKVLFEGLCFHAQQAVEKAMKAVLIAKGIPPPKTHNIRTLLDLLPQEVIAPQEIEDAASLTDYAVTLVTLSLSMKKNTKRRYDWQKWLSSGRKGLSNSEKMMSIKC